MVNISLTQRAYIAGFLDGDGSIYVRAKPNGTYRYGYQIAPSIILFQSEKSEKLFTEIHKIIGLGHIRRRKDGILELTISRIEEIRQFINLVKPFVLLKREQLVLIEKIINQKKLIENEMDFKALLLLVDSYRNLNYSKKRKIISPVETKR